MNLSAQIRNEAYVAIKPKMNAQEQAVHNYLIAHGPASAWSISTNLHQLITSTRRALFDLRRKGWVQEIGRELCPQTNANVTRWQGLPEFDFDDKGQGYFE